MYNNKSICVVVPAFNEETQIGKVIDTMPAYIDRIVVVDDSSRDKTVETVKRYQKKSEKIVPDRARSQSRCGWCNYQRI